MGTLTLADELVLIAYGDKSGRPTGSYLDHGVAAAYLIELAFAGRIAWLDGQIVLQDTAATGRPDLDDALEPLVDCDAESASEWLAAMAGVVGVQNVRDRMVDSGLLKRRTARLLGVVEWERYPAGDDGALEAEALSRVRSAVDRGHAQDTRTAVLCRLLAAVQLEARAFRSFSVFKRLELRDTLRATHLRRRGEPAVKGEAVARAIVAELADQVRVANSAARVTGGSSGGGGT